MTWGASCSASPWARVAPFWLALCFGLVQVPISAQSTTNGPPPADGNTPIEMDFDSSLKEALSLIEGTFPILQELRDEANFWKLDSQKWRKEATGLSSDLTKLRQDSEERLRLSEASLEQETNLRTAAESRQASDQAAIDQARGQLWLWGGAGIGIGLLTGVVIGLIL